MGVTATICDGTSEQVFWHHWSVAVATRAVHVFTPLPAWACCCCAGSAATGATATAARGAALLVAGSGAHRRVV